MLTVLGIHDLITPIYVSESRAHNRFIIEAEDASFDLPSGYQATDRKDEGVLPERCPRSVDRYFEMVRRACVSGRVGNGLCARVTSCLRRFVDEDLRQSRSRCSTG